MFDTVGGLPVHALVVHAVVVGVPLAALVAVVVALVPRLRRQRLVLWGTVLVVAGAFVTSVVAKLSGQSLRNRLGGQIAATHAERGNVLPWFVLALLVAVVLLALVAGRVGALTVVAGLLVLVTAAGATGWTIYTGHAGTSAVWKDLIANTQAPNGG